MTATREHLKLLLAARMLLLAVICVSMFQLTKGDARLNPWVMGLFVLAVLISAGTWLRLLWRTGPVSHHEFLLQILADVVLLGAALYHGGEDASPLDVMYFIPLTIAAATLPWRQTVAVVAVVVFVHELVCVYLAASPETGANRSEDVLGLMAAIMIAYFVNRMAGSSHHHEQELKAIREDYLRQRHQAELGMLAASTADLLGSPLETIALLVEELRSGASDPQNARMLDIAAQQILSCKRIASRLTLAAGTERAEGGERMSADEFVAGVVEKCRVIQPWVALRCRHQGPTPAPSILADRALEQALLVFLQAQPGEARSLDVLHAWNHEHMRVRMCRDGTTSASRSMDLMMARATVERIGGFVTESARADGSSCVDLRLPLASLSARAS
jgi:two-component system sensor histidine kinase RegB